eukprot:6172911-Pleurochrysis_carterae.AAC.4
MLYLQLFFPRQAATGRSLWHHIAHILVAIVPVWMHNEESLEAVWLLLTSDAPSSWEHGDIALIPDPLARLCRPLSTLYVTICLYILKLRHASSGLVGWVDLKQASAFTRW